MGRRDLHSIRRRQCVRWCFIMSSHKPLLSNESLALTMNHFPHPIDYAELAAAQRTDAAIQAILTYPEQSSTQIAQLPVSSNWTLYCDVSLGVTRPIIPATFRKRIFDMYHSLSHGGIVATKSLKCPKVVWPFMRRDITNFVKTCDSCQRNKVYHHCIIYRYHRNGCVTGI